MLESKFEFELIGGLNRFLWFECELESIRGLIRLYYSLKFILDLLIGDGGGEWWRWVVVAANGGKRR